MIGTLAGVTWSTSQAKKAQLNPLSALSVAIKTSGLLGVLPANPKSHPQGIGTHPLIVRETVAASRTKTIIPDPGKSTETADRSKSLKSNRVTSDRTQSQQSKDYEDVLIYISRTLYLRYIGKLK